MQRAGDLRGFFWRDDEGGSEENVIAVDGVDAALGGVGENVLVQGGLADAFGNVFFLGKWPAGGLVFYEFDAEEKAEPADFADVRMQGERG